MKSFLKNSLAVILMLSAIGVFALLFAGPTIVEKIKANRFDSNTQGIVLSIEPNKIISQGKFGNNSKTQGLLIKYEYVVNQTVLECEYLIPYTLENQTQLDKLKVNDTLNVLYKKEEPNISMVSPIELQE